MKEPTLPDSCAHKFYNFVLLINFVTIWANVVRVFMRYLERMKSFQVPTGYIYCMRLVTGSQ